ncbi:MAG: metallophosphoesterase [Fibrobacteres bacterium]|nr:metallophosphoesterase [Fibrobacterota bacterium]
MLNIRLSTLSALTILALAGCDDSTLAVPEILEPTKADSTASFMVASDLHYFSPGLLGDTALASFKAYLQNDRKMIAQSPALLHSFLDSVRKHMPKMVLLTGDLTKDGEKQSHQELADSLATLRKLGIQVYVIPGNHDVANPESQAYTSTGATYAPNVSSAEFAAIYKDCGFDQAVARDAVSLSYVAEPVPGVWLFAMDPTRWKDNVAGGKETVGGRFLPQTMDWLETQLDLAKAQGKVPVGAMHHGILEHFTGQAKDSLSADYVLAGFDTVGAFFAEKGMRVVFTGHFHANDIATKVFSSGSLTDIETGSLVTSPSPFRVGSLSANGSLSVRTSKIGGISGVTDFSAWSSRFLLEGMSQLIEPVLLAKGVPATYAPLIAGVGAKAYVAHYAGDESGVPSDSLTQSVIRTLAGFGPAGVGLTASITTLSTDLGPADSAGVFTLR